MRDNVRFKVAKVLRWFGRVIATVLNILFAMFLTYYAFIPTNPSGIGPELYNYAITMLLVVASLVLIWWKDLFAGLTLIAISVNIYLTIALRFEMGFIFWKMSGIPYLCAATLMILAWLLSRRRRKMGAAYPPLC